VVGIAHADRADAVQLGALDRLFHCPVRQHLADTVVPVDQRDRAAIDNELRLGDRLHAASTHARQVPVQP
jgi:hypothetical protein